MITRNSYKKCRASLAVFDKITPGKDGAIFI